MKDYNEDDLFDKYPSFMNKMDNVSSQIYTIFNLFGWTWVGEKVTKESIERAIMDLLASYGDHVTSFGTGRININVERFEENEEPIIEVSITI